MNKTPVVKHGALIYEEKTPIGTGSHTIYMDSPEWYVWIKRHHTFRMQIGDLVFTIRAEKKQRGTYYWYAYKRIAGKLFKRYIGMDEHVNIATIRSILWEQSLEEK